MRQRTKKDQRTSSVDGFLICQDYGTWTSSEGRIPQLRIEAGLTDAMGVNTPLIVDLRFVTDPHNAKRKYVFGLFRRNGRIKERVYQLEVTQGITPARNSHSASHEHRGEKRADVPDALTEADFNELLRYFCRQTKIEFQPPPTDPATPVRRKR